MDNPVLVEVTRGNRVESRHRGSVAIVDDEGKLVFGIGDVKQGVFARSAVKALQALPLVESGAADALDLDEAEIALACASHNGEAVHAGTAGMMLRKAGLSVEDLMCGTHWPRYIEDSAKLIEAGEGPCPLHNNCSGKHAGFLGLAKVVGVPTANYTDYDHPVQKEIRNVFECMAGEIVGADTCGTDGCSIPTYAMGLENTAKAFARFGTGTGLDEERAKAAERIYEACVNEPYMVAGRERFCTDIMDIFRGRVFVKTGAEGVFCASIPELGYGVALKCDDGAPRAAENMMASVLNALLERNDEEEQVLSTWLNKPLKNWNSIHVGDVRVVSDFAKLLKAQA
ncbi:asparaginase [Rhodobacteraceae bacterium RKSG542]|uniref:asparaginase n=1 Tax=Pseudovibrio flavus TaxID=2529854 RepID=UPI0012BC989D|nr:asparaginase [Pseudovibrio flavus]MTI18915.1 asparaginase [Pseudovibrio flavus]